MTRKVCVVITARPSYARIKTALRAVEEHPDLELQLVVGASALLERFGAPVDYIQEDGFDIAARVYMVVEGENLVTSAKSTGLGMVELASVFDNLRPDVVVTVADRYETLATAAAAAYSNVPVAHVQGGEITGSIDEKVRHAVTKLSDLHFVSNERAADFVRRMGENPEAIFVFVPIRYLYPSRTPVLIWPTNILGAIWGVLMLVILWRYPAIPRPLFLASLVFPVYYAVVSLMLHVRGSVAAVNENP